jgi:NADH-quinone oxidoreductase subunit A
LVISRDKIHEVVKRSVGIVLMASFLVPVLLFVLCAALMAVGMLVVGQLLGPKRSSAVKEMPYESGMDPIHDARKRFDFRFHAVAIAFLVFDVELLFLYPWAVANKDPQGVARVVQVAADSSSLSRGLIFAEVMVFVGLLAVGFIYAWRRGIFQWR